VSAGEAGNLVRRITLRDRDPVLPSKPYTES